MAFPVQAESYPVPDEIKHHPNAITYTLHRLR